MDITVSINGIEVVGECSNAIEGLSAIHRLRPDVVFLDIQMPRLSGIEMVGLIEASALPHIVFITAYDEHALKAFEEHAVDYLLKPISLDRFMKAVNKATEQFELRKREENSEAGTPGEGVEFFFVKADKKLVKIKYDEILYIEGLKDYVIIRLEQGRVVTLQTMKSLEDKLPLTKFKRIHRSYIVSIDKIHAVDGTSVDVYEKGQIKQLPIGKNYRDEILEIVNRNKL